ncbi:protein-glutamate O-methyltransferase CheR [bacterium]|nr:MAG: protein-glutamate O-methyltransferase CheR [bacterium]
MDLPNGQALLDENGLKKILEFIREYKGVDLSSYRQSFLARRVRIRLSATKVKSCLEYTRLIEKKPEEFNLFLNELSINVTEFFRDPDVYSAFGNIVLSDIIRRKEASGARSLRVWSSACATGEEPYSIAILVAEALKDKPDFTAKILASDVDAQALEAAAKGEYEAKFLQKIDPEILKKFFIPLGPARYRVREDIRKMVRFQAHNLFSEPPFKYLDIIFCRNVLIYLNRAQAKELFIGFNRALSPGGYLVLGKVETLWERDMFVPVDPRMKIYQKLG